MILIKTYTLAVSPTLPAIPLFTLAGFLLAEGRSSERLLRVFRAWFGWIPGGTAVVCALLCSFFTVFTGGSGVTILALGGLLLPALIKEGYRERFSLGPAHRVGLARAAPAAGAPADRVRGGGAAANRGHVPRRGPARAS